MKHLMLTAAAKLEDLADAIDAGAAAEAAREASDALEDLAQHADLATAAFARHDARFLATFGWSGAEARLRAKAWRDVAAIP